MSKSSALFGLAAFCLLFSFAFVAGLQNGVGQLPAMGYNTWNDLRCHGINAANVTKIASMVQSLGLQKAGYNYVNIDDCWNVGRDNFTHVLLPDPKAFPEGIKPVADFIHQLGMKVGIYTDRGPLTCALRAGSMGFETIDAQTFASWGVDYLKEDSCWASINHTVAFQQYGVMRDALNATGREIYFSLCGWAPWYAPVGSSLGNSWRTSPDVNHWPSMYQSISIIENNLSQYAGPGGWNDADMLVGSGQGEKHSLFLLCAASLFTHSSFSPAFLFLFSFYKIGSAVFVTPDQSRTQFSLWSIFSSPLLIGTTLSSITPWDLTTYTNKDVIAINQDPMGKAGMTIVNTCPKADVHAAAFGATAPVPACYQIWVKELFNGDMAMVFVNFSPIATKVTCDQACLVKGLHKAMAARMKGKNANGGIKFHVLNLWSHKSEGVVADMSVALGPNGGSEMYRLRPMN